MKKKQTIKYIIENGTLSKFCDRKTIQLSQNEIHTKNLKPEG